MTNPDKPWGYDADKIAQDILSMRGDDIEGRAGAGLEAYFRSIWRQAYEAGYEAGGKPDNTERFIKAAKRAIKIADSGISGELKFKLIFSENVSQEIFASGIPLDWQDPDTSYEEDVRAFVNAVEARLTEIERI